MHTAPNVLILIACLLAAAATLAADLGQWPAAPLSRAILAMLALLAFWTLQIGVLAITSLALPSRRIWTGATDAIAVSLLLGLFSLFGAAGILNGSPVSKWLTCYLLATAYSCLFLMYLAPAATLRNKAD